MPTLHPTAVIPQTPTLEKLSYSATTKAAIAAILLAGSSAIASAETIHTESSGQSDPWNATELFLEVGSSIALCALVYYATKRPRN